jgi:transcriptional regulator with XRE-family HTH domain/tetratricopeptide (TPR) repeat protein
VQFAELLNTERRARGLTQEQLAERAGVSSRSIRTLESGSVKPRRGTVEALGSALQLDPGQLQLLLWAAGFGLQYRATGSAPLAARPVPAQLPRDLPDFVGRADTTDALAGELLGAAAGRRAGVAAISGLGGLGKTTLAVHIAHRLRAAFPDGQLFVDLGGGLGPGRDPDVLLDRMLRDLGVFMVDIPFGVAAKSALLRTVTADRRILFVLDDAHDSAQVRPLLPGSAGCAVLITSRRYLAALDGVRHAGLEPFTAEQAGELVDRVRAATGPRPADGLRTADLAGVLERCGGLPLAVRIVAARMAGPVDAGRASFTAALDRPRAWLDSLEVEDVSVRNTIAASMSALDGHAQRGVLARRALSFFGRWPGGALPAPVVAVGLGVPTAAGEAALDYLLELSLVERTPGSATATPRYLPHDLVRVCAAEQDEAAAAGPDGAVSAADRAAAPARSMSVASSTAPAEDPIRTVFDWYTHALDRAVAVFADYFIRPELPPGTPPDLPEFTDRPAALAWCEAEYGNVLALVRYGAQHRWDTSTARLSLLAMPFGEQMMRMSEWIETHRIGLECARHIGDRHFEGRLLTGLAAAYRWSAWYDLAAEAADGALTVFRELGDRARIGVLLVTRGRIMQHLGDHPAAAAAFTEAMEFLRGGESGPYWYASAINELGISLTRGGDPAAGAARQREALQAARAAGLGHYEPVVLLNLSISLTLAGDLAAATEAVESAEAEAGRLSQPVLVAEILRQRGEIAAATGFIGRAIALLRESLAGLSGQDGPEADEIRARLAELVGLEHVTGADTYGI